MFLCDTKRNDTKDQGNFVSEIELVPFNRLSWNANDSVINFMVSAIQMDRFYGQLVFKIFNCGSDLIMNNIEYAYNVDNKILHKIGNDTKDQGNFACKTECVSFNRLLWTLMTHL